MFDYTIAANDSGSHPSFDLAECSGVRLKCCVVGVRVVVEQATELV
jgi:hypothetical protein